MPTRKDYDFLQFVINGTESGKVRWEPTAERDQYAASFKGKYTVIVDRGVIQSTGQPFYWMALKDTDDRELLKITEEESALIPDLFHKAARASLNVDAAIDEIMSEQITDEDIPF
jgi:hypothetical protein